MKIAFFGSFGSFDYFKIGGTESLTRRLATGLREKGHQADFVVYGAPTPQQHTLPAGIEIYHFVELAKALVFLLENYDQVISLYLRPADRLAYVRFRWTNRRRLLFHQVYAAWPDSTLKRQAAFLDGRIYPFNGLSFCVSPRICRQVQRWTDRAMLLLPPVSADFFLHPGEKAEGSKIRVMYIGRTELDKGFGNVMELFNLLGEHSDIALEIHGFHHPTMKTSVQIHEELCRQNRIRYYYTPYQSYSPQVDQNLRRTLRETDILVLPYRRLSSTMDTPVLLLEGMASLCAILTYQLGDIPTLYGHSPFLLRESDSMAMGAQRVLEARNFLPQERQRIFERNRELDFETSRVADRLISALS